MMKWVDWRMAGRKVGCFVNGSVINPGTWSDECLYAHFGHLIPGNEPLVPIGYWTSLLNIYHIEKCFKWKLQVLMWWCTNATIPRKIK
jgi:hypothetical protein